MTYEHHLAPVNAPGSHMSSACCDCGASGLDSEGQTCRSCDGTGLAHPYPDR